MVKFIVILHNFAMLKHTVVTNLKLKEKINVKNLRVFAIFNVYIYRRGDQTLTLQIREAVRWITL